MKRLLNEGRNITVNLTQAIQDWESQASAPFVWGGVRYLFKMKSDLLFLAKDTRLVSQIYECVILRLTRLVM